MTLLSAGNPEHWLVVREALERPDIVFDARFADGRFGELHSLAMDAVRARPDVIVAQGAAALMAARKATTQVPIVMAAAADVAAGGNVTGVAIDGAQLAGRIFNLIRELKSNARRIAMLANADDPSAQAFVVALNQAAARARLPVGMSRVRTAGDYDVAFEQWDRLRVQAVIVHSGVDPARAAQLALNYGMPAIGVTSGFVGAGGLLSYSESPRELGRKVVTFVDRILKGAKPAELRVEQVEAFDLAVNLKTAKAIDIELPDSLLARADAMIQ